MSISHKIVHREQLFVVVVVNVLTFDAKTQGSNLGVANFFGHFK